MKNLTKGNLYKNFFSFAFPLILSGLLSRAYNIVDTIIAGKYLGDNGLAAIGATSAFITVVSAVFWGYGDGFAVYIANLFGAKRYKDIKSTFFTNAVFCCIIMLITSFICICFTPQILNFLKVNDEIADGAAIYFKVYMLGLFLIILNEYFVLVMNAMGSTVTPFLMSLVAAVINIIGNIISVTVLGWGVAGIAASSVFSAFVTDIIYIIKLNSIYNTFGLKSVKRKFDLSKITVSIKLSVACMGQQTVMYLSSFIISPIVNALGTAAIASYTVSLKIYEIIASVYQDSSKTLTNFAAQCVGSGDYKNIGKGVKVGLIQGMAFSVPIVIVFAVFAREVSLVFFPKEFVGEALDLTVRFVSVFLPFILANLINNLFHAFARGISQSKPLFISTCVGSVARVAFSWLFSISFGMDGIYFGWAMSWVAEMILVVILYFANYSNPQKIERAIYK